MIPVLSTLIALGRRLILYSGEREKRASMSSLLKTMENTAGRLGGRQAGSLDGWQAGRLTSWLDGWQPGSQKGRVAGWKEGW